MAYKEGADFEKHHNGSTGIDGENRTSDGYKRVGDTYFKPDGNTGEYVAKRSNRNGRSDDHLHYYKDNKTGNRTVKDKKTGQRYLADDFADAFKNFMGW